MGLIIYCSYWPWYDMAIPIFWSIIPVMIVPSWLRFFFLSNFGKSIVGSPQLHWRSWTSAVRSHEAVQKHVLIIVNSLGSTACPCWTMNMLECHRMCLFFCLRCWFMTFIIIFPVVYHHNGRYNTTHVQTRRKGFLWEATSSKGSTSRLLNCHQCGLWISQATTHKWRGAQNATKEDTGMVDKVNGSTLWL